MKDLTIECERENAFTLGPHFVGMFDVMLTDPPYSAHVHASATSQSARGGTRKRELGFESLSVKARHFVADCASRVARWSVVYSDVESANWLALSAQARGVEYVRTLPWVRWSMPQLSGDRPPQGFEALVCLHRAGPKGKPIRKHWSGPGNLTHLAHNCLRGEGKHKCEKPLAQALDLVSFFSEAGESVFDPFMGSGTFGQACRLLGRHYYGCEQDEGWATHARARCGAVLGERDRKQLATWLAAEAEPLSALTEGPSLERAAKRKADKERARTWL